MPKSSSGELPHPPSDAESGFAFLGLDPALLKVLSELGYEEATPIQRQAIPPLMEGKDVLGQAATGTGKTAAFALPLLHRLNEQGGRSATPRALILVPTRELAIQVGEALNRYGKGLNLQAVAIYGGQSMEPQLRALKRGIDIVVATPGRALDHLRRKSLQVQKIQTLVLDEADEMLDMGFADDLETILSALPVPRQTALFSATLPPRIAKIAEKSLNQPVRIQISREKPVPGSLPKIRQVAYAVQRASKLDALGRILKFESPTSAIVFCRTRNDVDQLTERLAQLGERCQPLHGGMSQEQRDRAIKNFRNQQAQLLVATDVAARGLDIDHLSHVINYDVPQSPEVYVHRIGRTGRAGREGVAITLIENREMRQLQNVERLTKQKIQMLPVPTPSQSQAQELTRVQSSLREVLVQGQLEKYRDALAPLAKEFDPLDVAAAVLKQLHPLKDIVEKEVERVVESYAPPRPVRSRAGSDRSSERSPGRPAERTGAGSREKSVPIYFGAGRNQGLGPKDWIQLISREADVKPNTFGAIQLSKDSSIIEVPAKMAHKMVETLQNLNLRGRKITVSLEAQSGSSEEAPAMSMSKAAPPRSKPRPPPPAPSKRPAASSQFFQKQTFRRPRP